MSRKQRWRAIVSPNGLCGGKLGERTLERGAPLQQRLDRGQVVGEGRLRGEVVEAELGGPTVVGAPPRLAGASARRSWSTSGTATTGGPGTRVSARLRGTARDHAACRDAPIGVGSLSYTPSVRRDRRAWCSSVASALPATAAAGRSAFRQSVLASAALLAVFSSGASARPAEAQAPAWSGGDSPLPAIGVVTGMDRPARGIGVSDPRRHPSKSVRDHLTR